MVCRENKICDGTFSPMSLSHVQRSTHPHIFVVLVEESDQLCACLSEFIKSDRNWNVQEPR
jgi:hypothetical protein